VTQLEYDLKELDMLSSSKAADLTHSYEMENYVNA